MRILETLTAAAAFAAVAFGGTGDFNLVDEVAAPTLFVGDIEACVEAGLTGGDTVRGCDSVRVNK